MLNLLLAAAIFFQNSAVAETAKDAPRPSVNQTASKDFDSDPAALLKVKRVFVESFGEDAVSKEMQSMVVSSLVASKRFKVTENRDRADAILKGVALEKSSQELHAYSEGTAVGRGAISDSSAHTETLNTAKLSVRLVNPDGDVIWTNTQESKGAKYKGASADAADMCIKQLLRDVEKLEAGNALSLPAASEPTHK